MISIGVRNIRDLSQYINSVSEAQCEANIGFTIELYF